MKLQRETTIAAPPETVWKLLGPRYAEAYKWASSIDESVGKGPRGAGSIAGAPCTGRACETELGTFRETIEVYDEAGREVAYSAQGDKMPFFVKRMVNHWRVLDDGEGASRVTMELRVSLMFPFNILMALPMRMQLGGVLKKAHEELKYFIEHDETPHPRKQQARARLLGAAA